MQQQRQRASFAASSFPPTSSLPPSLINLPSASFSRCCRRRTARVYKRLPGRKGLSVIITAKLSCLPMWPNYIQRQSPPPCTQRIRPAGNVCPGRDILRGPVGMFRRCRPIRRAFSEDQRSPDTRSAMTEAYAKTRVLRLAVITASTPVQFG